MIKDLPSNNRFDFRDDCAAKIFYYNQQRGTTDYFTGYFFLLLNNDMNLLVDFGSFIGV